MSTAAPIGDFCRFSATLRRFLRTDNPGAALSSAHPITQAGQLKLQVKLGNGAIMKPICGLRDYPRLHLQISEERLENGDGIKLLRAWALRREVGDNSKARLTYALAYQWAGSGWQILSDPYPLAGAKDVQISRYNLRRTEEALLVGTGEAPFYRWWSVYHNQKNRKSYIYYSCCFEDNTVKRLEISGFNGHARVISRIAEEDTLLVAYFYQTRADAEASTGCIKKVALSEKSPVGPEDFTAPRWLPLRKPRILETSNSAYCQSIRLRTEIIEGFLHAKAEDGAFLDIDPRKVDKTGRISFFLDGNDINIPGHENFIGKFLFGRIKVIEGEKRVYFWPSKEGRAFNHPAIVADGHILARKNALTGVWEIVPTTVDTATLQKNRAARAYSRYLLGSDNPRPYESFWPVRKRMADGKEAAIIHRSIENRKVLIPVPITLLPCENGLYSITRTLKGGFKFVEFWKDKSAYNRHEKPVNTRIIAYKDQTAGKWRSCCVALNPISIARFIGETHAPEGNIKALLEDEYFYRDKFVYYLDAIRKILRSLGW
ncbi:MAG: hypothetical protein WCW67_04025 [Candidatus Margulisiibacteriota bacterium]